MKKQKQSTTWNRTCALRRWSR